MPHGGGRELVIAMGRSDASTEGTDVQAEADILKGEKLYALIVRTFISSISKSRNSRSQAKDECTTITGV